MKTTGQDLRHAWRQLRQAPEFAFLAVVTLALGIGANTALYTVVESVLLRPLPYPDSEKLTHIGNTAADSSGLLSWLDYRDIAEQARTLASVAAYSNDVGIVQSSDGSVGAVATQATPSLFDSLGVRPLLGATFSRGNPREVLLSEGLWRKSFGSDPAIVGKTVRVNGQERTVVGVMPRTFRFPEAVGPDVEYGMWLAIQPSTEMLHARDYRVFMIVAKRARGATMQQAQAELAAIAGRIRNVDASADRRLAFRAVSYSGTVTGPVQGVLMALLAALGLVLLIACSNVANLLIARCLARRHEFAVRAALGSGRGRLAGQMVMEAGLVSVLGCALGLVLAFWIIAAVRQLPPGTVPRAHEIELRWTVLIPLAAIATLTTMLSAILPALFVSRTDSQGALMASRSLGSTSVRARTAAWLVAGEVALSAVLLIATGLLFRTLWGLEHVRLGFETKNVTSFTAIPGDPADNTQVSIANAVYQPLIERLRRSPGIEGAAFVTAAPLSGVTVQAAFRLLGSPREALQSRLAAVSGGYERLMGTPVVRGRDIGEQDTADAPFIATVNETLARTYFAGREALGQQLDLGGPAVGMPRPYTIVGVVADQADTSAAQAPQPLLMLPYRQVPPSSAFYPALLKAQVYFVVRTRGTVPIAQAARALFQQLAPDLAVDNFQTMQQAVDRANFGARFGLYLIGAFAGLAVLMVVAGLYGVLSQLVNRRQREFGVRMALGATRRAIVVTVLLQGLLIVALGVTAGTALALTMGRLIESFLFGVKPLDAGTYIVVAAALFSVGALAALLPAWRAAASDPMAALRET